MIGYTLGRAAWAVALCLILSLATFTVFYVVPRQQRIQNLRGRFLDVQRAQQFSGPVVVQYAHWVGGVAHGSFGHSYVSRRPVSRTLLDATPVTLALTIGGAVVWLLIALPLGILSAIRLPWFTFALVFAALYVRMIRASVTEVLQEDYVQMARAKGMSDRGCQLRRRADARGRRPARGDAGRAGTCVGSTEQARSEGAGLPVPEREA